MGHIMQFDIMCHAPERRDTGAGTNQENILLEMIFLQYKHALRTPKGQFAANTYFVEQIMSTCSPLKQHNYQLKNIRAIRPAGDRIASYPFINFFVDRQVECDKLTRCKIKRSQLG